MCSPATLTHDTHARQDLHLLCSARQAEIGWQLLQELHVAGNWNELCRTRELLVEQQPGQDGTMQVPLVTIDRMCSLTIECVLLLDGTMQMDFAFYRRKLEAKLRRISQEMLLEGRGSLSMSLSNISQLVSSFASSFATKMPLRRREVTEEDIEQTAQGLKRILTSRSAWLSTPEQLEMRGPAEPSLRTLLAWSADELCAYLSCLEGGLAKEMPLKEYAQLLRKAHVGGSQLEVLTHENLGEMGVPAGDRFPLLKTLRLLAAFYTNMLQDYTELKVSVRQADHLPKLHAFGGCDAQVELRLQHGASYQDFRTAVAKRSLHPVWPGQRANAHTFYISPDDSPPQLSVFLYDVHHVLHSGASVGAHHMSEVLEDLPPATRRRFQPESVSLREIMNECAQKPVTKTLKLYKQGEPVIGHDTRPATVDVTFELSRALAYTTFKMQVAATRYPRRGISGQKIELTVHEDPALNQKTVCASVRACECASVCGCVVCACPPAHVGSQRLTEHTLDHSPRERQRRWTARCIPPRLARLSQILEHGCSSTEIQSCRRIRRRRQHR